VSWAGSGPRTLSAVPAPRRPACHAGHRTPPGRRSLPASAARPACERRPRAGLVRGRCVCETRTSDTQFGKTSRGVRVGGGRSACPAVPSPDDGPRSGTWVRVPVGAVTCLVAAPGAAPVTVLEIPPRATGGRWWMFSARISGTGIPTFFRSHPVVWQPHLAWEFLRVALLCRGGQPARTTASGRLDGSRLGRRHAQTCRRRGRRVRPLQ
jgi:hypothetical protein